MPTLGYSNAHVRRFHVDQVESVWCWAASVEMALRVHGIIYAKEAIAAACHGVDADGRPIVKPGSVDDVHRFLNTGYFNVDGHHYVIRSRHYEGLPAARAIKTCVHEQGRPVLFWFQREGQDLGHVIVCTGVEVDAIPNGNVDLFHVMDPGDSRIIGYTCAEICNSIRHTWTVTDVRISPQPVRPPAQASG